MLDARSQTALDRDHAKARPHTAKDKRILLLNSCKQDGFSVNRIHMGLSLLGGILRNAKHEVMLIDFAFLRDLKDCIRVPEIEAVLDEFQPGLVGISVFTYLYDECQDLIERTSHRPEIPIILGGPHFSVFPEDFSSDPRISYILRGEAESVILSLVETAKRENHPVFINCPSPSADEIPAVDLDIVYGHEFLKLYQIQLSRGCPYQCSFCNIERVAGRRVRPRNIETCLQEITEAKTRHPQISTIVITDDCPTFDKERFKTFLKLFAAANLGCELSIDNVRANLLDEEMIRLYVEAGGRNLCVGTESGHPEVFEAVNKGESLDDIVHAARLIRKYGLVLGLCFVIGLPGDTLKRHARSVALARSLKPDYLFWNMCIPWPGTQVHQWYTTHGRIGNPRNFSTLVDPTGNYGNPVCATKEFPEKDRIKAWFMANLETQCYFKRTRDLGKLFFLSIRYNFFRSFVNHFTRCFIPIALDRLIHVFEKKFGLRLPGVSPRQIMKEGE
jgi:anaerobic magnesium-protoporphyrin IX monomethyl ester cyclase